MATDSGGRELLPMACTLGPTDGARRLDEWRRVVASAGAGREVATGKVTLIFRDVPGIGQELHRLVDAERECCTFLRWDLQAAGAHWQVVIAGTDEALRSLPFTS